MAFYSRESGVNLGALVVRHTLSRGGGCTYTHLYEARLNYSQIGLERRDGNLLFDDKS